MYAGTKFNWYDQSGIETTVEQVEITNRPLFMTAITADKGTEDLVRLYGDDFYKMYGRSLSFAKHGQPLLQAGRIIDKGAELLVKRIVANDATLSNIILVAKVTDTKIQSKTETGELLYTNPNTGEETTESVVQKTDTEGNLLYTTVAGVETTDVQTQKVNEDDQPVFVKADGTETTDTQSQKTQGVNLVFTKADGTETTDSQSQKVDKSGNPLYINSNDGSETTATDDGSGHNYLPVMVDNTPVMVDNTAVMLDNAPVMVDCEAVMNDTGCSVKWEVQTVSNCKKYDDVMKAAEELFDAEAGVFPMVVVTDIGRNADCKAISITPDYDVSRSIGFMIYKAAEFEGTRSEESISITLNPSVKYKNVSYAINKYSMGELSLGTVDGVFDAYVERLSAETGIDANELKMYDLINGTNCKGVAIAGIVIDPDSVNLSYEYGISLQSGSNGTEFGDAPFHSEAYGPAIAKLFAGDYTDEVWDVDIHKVCAVCDANYPKVVKDAIAKFVNFREDCFYFRDLGLGLDTFDLIYAEADKYNHDKFVGNYMTSYQIVDPYSNKRIEVTSMYDFAPALVDHFVAGKASNPLAGDINGFVMDSAIRGTVNYVPRKTPKVDQKGLLDDSRINYATYYEYEGDLVVDSLYTSQEEYSQLSYINNILAIQEVMRAVRNACPKNRFKFTTGNDFNDYAESVKSVLDVYKNNFETLNFVYLEDSAKESQKIYYAALEFRFKNWAQSEIFDLYALNNVEISEE